MRLRDTQVVHCSASSADTGDRMFHDAEQRLFL